MPLGIDCWRGSRRLLERAYDNDALYKELRKLCMENGEPCPKRQHIRKVDVELFDNEDEALAGGNATWNVWVPESEQAVNYAGGACSHLVSISVRELRLLIQAWSLVQPKAYAYATDYAEFAELMHRFSQRFGFEDAVDADRRLPFNTEDR